MANWDESRKKVSEECNVSRETMLKLDQYGQLLKKWNKAINLVAPSTIPHFWIRHVLDSAQIVSIIPDNAKTWADIGSGAGFPGLVVSCLRPDIHVTCLESDKRKSVFLQTIIRDLGLNASVIAERIENVPPLGVDIISARALAPINALLGYADRHLTKTGHAILLKGSGYKQEIKAARQNWAFDIKAHPSKTDPEAAVLFLGDIKRE